MSGNQGKRDTIIKLMKRESHQNAIAAWENSSISFFEAVH